MKAISAAMAKFVCFHHGRFSSSSVLGGMFWMFSLCFTRLSTGTQFPFPAARHKISFYIYHLHIDIIFSLYYVILCSIIVVFIIVIVFSYSCWVVVIVNVNINNVKKSATLSRCSAFCHLHLIPRWALLLHFMDLYYALHVFLNEIMTAGWCEFR